MNLSGKLQKKMNEYQVDLGKENVTFTTVVNNVKYFGYYFQKMNFSISFAQTYNVSGNDLRVLKNILDTCSTKYFVHSQTFPGRDETDALIRTKYPCIIDELKYGRNCFIRLYSRIESVSCISSEKPDQTMDVDFNNGKTCITKNENTMQNGTHSGHVQHLMKLDSGKEFGPGYMITLRQISPLRYSKLRISFNALLPDTSSEAQMVAELRTAMAVNNTWSSARLKNFLNPGVPGEVFHTLFIPEGSTSSDTLKIYMWNPEKKEVSYNDLKISFFK